MPTLYCFKNFNNYINRRAIGQGITTVNDFVGAFKSYDYILTGTYVNFNPKDGGMTTLVLGSKNNPYNGDCDYLLYSDDNETITSRWFIGDHDFQCSYQYNVTLVRDVLVDHWARIMAADCFIEKAILKDDDPLLFNQEAITTNQIKKDEIKLFDESGCQWIVGYMNKKHEKTTVTTITADVTPDYRAESKAALETALGAASGTEYVKFKSADFYLKIYQPRSSYQGTPYSFTELTYRRTTSGWTLWSRTTKDALLNTLFVTDRTEEQILTFLNSSVNYATCYNSYNWSLYIDPSDEAKYNAILPLSSKTCEITAGQDKGYYKINVSSGTDSDTIGESTINTALNSALAAIKYSGSGNAKIDHADVVTYNDRYDLEEIAEGGYTVTLGTTLDRLHCNAAFDMFVIPYKDTVIRNSAVGDENWPGITITKSLAMSIAQGLAVALDDNLYDLQLLPYCPLNGLTFTSSYIDIKTLVTDSYTIVYDGVNPACIVLWATSNSGSKYITGLNKSWLQPGNKKINNQCDFIRLVSPNYNGTYELNVAKNEGVSEIKIDYTYIPYRPYIHVAPIYNVNGLYGDHNDDAVGLICGGDFSISYLSDAWEKYMTENKNYIDIFDRTTQNMDTTYKYQRLESILGAGVGAISAGVTGGVINPALGVLGGLASAAGGIADLTIQQKLRNEAMDYRQDLFGMQLDNIKALPYSLAKVSTINENNKGVPFIEYYTCTEREKAAVALKIAYNSMTVGAIGKLSEYIINRWHYGDIEDKGYIKAKVIRIEELSEDTHIANLIADELYKGVYIR